MKNFLLGMLFTLCVLAVGACAYLRLGLSEVRADISPSRWESSLMRMSIHASVRREAPELSNPWKPTDDTLIAGGKIYLGACAGCLGTPGKPFGGKGPVVFPPIPELPVVGTQYTEAQIFWIAKYGIRRSAMFANGVYLKDDQLWSVAAYIKRMNSLPPTVEAAVAKLADDAPKN
jgi:mono/diheme cytochrome c family protein